MKSLKERKLQSTLRFGLPVVVVPASAYGFGGFDLRPRTGGDRASLNGNNDNNYCSQGKSLIMGGIGQTTKSG